MESVEKMNIKQANPYKLSRQMRTINQLKQRTCFVDEFAKSKQHIAPPTKYAVQKDWGDVNERARPKGKFLQDRRRSQIDQIGTCEQRKWPSPSHYRPDECFRRTSQVRKSPTAIPDKAPMVGFVDSDMANKQD